MARNPKRELEVPPPSHSYGAYLQTPVAGYDPANPRLRVCRKILKLNFIGTANMSLAPSTSPPPSPADSNGGRSHFATGAKLSGDLTVPGLMELSGHIDGGITADSIVIEANGSAVGELHADSVAVKGRFEGNIHGRDVKLHSSAKVSGEIFYQTLTIESGAEVNSSCSRETKR
jgi:cytoskeletal protein CcmA (bactofilin family)